MRPGNDDEVLDLLTDAATTARQAKDALDRITGST
jgi:hypothetical protein